MPAKAGHGIQGRFGPSVQANVVDCITNNRAINCAGAYMRRRRIDYVGLALGQILRHSRHLQVNERGFAWMDDVVAMIADGEDSPATVP